MKQYILFFLLITVICSHITLFAQNTSDESLNRYIDDPDMKALSEYRRPSSFRYGAWLTPLYFDEIEGNSRLAMSQTTIRAWLDSMLWQNIFVYLRLMNKYQGVFAKNQLGTAGEAIDDSKNTFDLELGFIRYSAFNNTVQFEIGRKYFRMGTGLVLNGRGDGGEINFYTPIVDLSAIFSYTGFLNKHENPYNLSDRDYADGAKRIFTGGSLEKHFRNQTLYFFSVIEIDRAEDDPANKMQYNAEYYAMGLKGYIGGYSNYYCEFVYQTGTSYKMNSDEERSINAIALNSGLDIYLSLPTLPIISLQYAFGSGDKDRGSYTVPNANTNSDDNAFMYFGTFHGGYGLRPVLANLHVLRAGFSCAPFSFSSTRMVRRITFIAKYSYYWKYYSSGVINAGEAPRDERDVGHGVDIALRWGAFYDLTVFINYGLFLPGDAYESYANNPRNFILAGAIATF
ncbi:MAG: alginate export family protein [Spirochaetes bacterium]|nr:alginate export family protein [Spirochaetota bacterium]